MADDDGAGSGSRRVGVQWLVAAAAVITAVSGLVGVVIAGTGGSDSGAKTARSVADGGALAASDGGAPAANLSPRQDELPVPSIEGTRRPADGRWVVIGRLAELTDGAPRDYDVYVIAETSTGTRYVSLPAEFVDPVSWRATFQDSIDVGAELTFIPGVHVRVSGAFGGPGLQPQSVDDPAHSSFRDRVQAGLADFDVVGSSYTPAG